MRHGMSQESEIAESDLVGVQALAMFFLANLKSFALIGVTLLRRVPDIVLNVQEKLP